MSQASRDTRRLNALIRCVYGLFFVSGALGLIYEVLWLRKLLLVFGSTVYAVSTVLTAFFGGLALGSWLFGRLIDRHESAGLRWYAACEAAIGVSAFLTWPLFGVIERIYIPIYRASGFSPGALVSAGFLCSVGVLLIPTTLMGGTFPLLSRFVIRTTQERGPKIASLYGINTVGAMIGTLWIYYVALPDLGWRMTLLFAGLTNLLLGVVARMLNRWFQEQGFGPVESRAAEPLPARRVESAATAQEASLSNWLICAFGLSGFSAMAYEVAWTRSLSLVLGSSIYAFCLMLATFLGGIALGSAIARLVLRSHPASAKPFVLLQTCLAGYGLLSIPLFGLLPDWLVSLWPLLGHSFTGLSVLQAVLSMSVMALPTVCMGFLFPLVGELVTGQMSQLGKRLGLVYAVNTLGGIAGSFLCGFWLIPHLGIPWTLVIAALGNLLAGLLLYIRTSPHSLVARVSFAAVLFAVYLGVAKGVSVPSWQRQVLAAGVFNNPNGFRGGSVAQVAQQQELLFYRESLNTTVSVHRDPRHQNLFLKVSGKTDASTGLDMGTQILAAHLPLLLNPLAKRVLVIGLGSGVTLGSVGRYPVSVVHCAELDPAVVQGARFFADYNYHVHDDPRVRIFTVDGRNFLLATPERYDAIISEPSNPWMAGVANLFTLEFYELAKKRLTPHGIMGQWVQLYRIFPADVKLILKTFQEVFPYVSVWSTIPGDLVLVGSLEPQHLDYDQLRQQLARPAIQQDLNRVLLGHPRVLLDRFRLSPERVRQVVSDVTWLHTDDQPWIEFNAPKALYVGHTLTVNYQGFDRLKVPVATVVAHAPQDEDDADTYEALGRAYQYCEEPEKAIDAFERVVRLNPRDSAAYLRLGELYAHKTQLVKADEALRMAVALDPDSLEAHQELARFLWKQDKRPEALQAYERAAGLAVPDQQFAEELGNVLGEADRPLEAVEYFRSALSQTNDPPAPLFLGFAKAATAAKQLDEAAHILTTALKRYPDAVEGFMLLAEVKREAGQQAEAARLFREVLKRAPTMAKAYFALGQLALEAGDLPGARQWLTTGLRYDAYNPQALETLQRLQGPNAG